MRQCKTLFISNTNDVTTDYLISRFKLSSKDFLRINSEDINKIEIEFSPKYGTIITTDDAEYHLSLVQSVYYRRAPITFNSNDDVLDKPYLINERRHFFEGIYLSLNNCKWINPIFNIYSGERKLMQLVLAEKLGLTTPETIVTNRLNKAKKFIEDQNSCIIKPISHGLQQRGDDFYSIYTTSIDASMLSELELTEIFDTPIFLQKKIENQKDIRVTIIGNTVFSASIEKENSDDVDWRKPEVKKVYKEHKLPKPIEEKLITMNKHLGLIYSAIDLILTPLEEYVFLEINPVGEWGWLEKELDFKITDVLINELLCRK